MAENIVGECFCYEIFSRAEALDNTQTHWGDGNLGKLAMILLSFLRRHQVCSGKQLLVNPVVALTPFTVFMLKPDIIPVWNKGNGSRRDSRQFDSSTEQSFLEAAFDKFDIGTTM